MAAVRDKMDALNVQLSNLCQVCSSCGRRDESQVCGASLRG